MISIANTAYSVTCAHFLSGMLDIFTTLSIFDERMLFSIISYNIIIFLTSYIIRANHKFTF